MKIYGEKAGQISSEETSSYSQTLFLNINELDYEELKKNASEYMLINVTPLDYDAVDVYEATGKKIAITLSNLNSTDTQDGFLDMSLTQGIDQEPTDPLDYVIEYSKSDATAELRKKQPGQEEISINVVGDEAIPPGDSSKYGLFLALQEMFRKEHEWVPPDDIIWKAAREFAWTNPFPGAKLNEKGEARFSTHYGKDDYFSALHYMYGENNFITENIIAYNSGEWESSKEFKWGKDFYLWCIIEASELTEKEALYFDEWMQWEYEDSYIGKSSLELMWIIQNFKRDVLANLGNYFHEYKDPKWGKVDERSSLLAEYGREGDPEKTAEIKRLIPLINGLDPSIISYYTEREPLTKTSRDKLNDMLKDSLLTAKDLERFDSYVRFEMVSKAFKMLEKNQELLLEEKEKLKDQENLDAVASIIRGEKANLHKAKWKQFQGLKAWKQLFPHSKKYWLERTLESRGMRLGQLLKPFAEKYGVSTETMYVMIYPEHWGAFEESVDFRELQVIRSFIADFMHLYGAALLSYKDPREYDYMDQFCAEAATYRDGSLNPAPWEASHFRYFDMLDEVIPDLKLAEDLYRQSEKNIIEKAKYTRKDGKEVEFRILKDLTFNYPYLARFSKKEIKEKLKKKIDEKIENVYTVHKSLNSDPDYVWEMGAVLDYGKLNLGILPNTNAAAIINDHVVDEEKAKMWTSLGIGALSLLLAIGGAFTGGTTTVLGIALLSGSVIVGIADVVVEYNRYQFGRAVSNTALTDADELGKVDYSALGVVMAIVGLGIDVSEAIRGIKAIMKLNKLVKITRIEAETVFNTLATEGKIINKYGKEIAKKEFLDIVEKAAKEFGPGMQKSKAFQDFATAHNIAPSSRPGLFKLMSENQEGFDVLKSLQRLETGVLDNIGLQITFEGRLSGATGEMCAFFKQNPESLTRILNNFAGPNEAAFGNLPDVWDIIKNSNAYKHPDLVATILEDARYQYKLLDNPNDIGIITSRYENYLKSATTRKSTDFTTFLGKGSQAYSLKGGTRKTIAEHFAGNPAMMDLFSRQGDFKAKNLALISTTEPDLASKISKGELLSGNQKLQKALNKMLDEDLIGTTTDLAYSRSKVIRRLNQVLSENISIGEFRALDAAGIPFQQASRGSLFDNWLVTNVKRIWGNDVALQSKLTFSADQLKAADSFKDFPGIRVIIDNYYLDDGIKVALEFKHVAGKLGAEAQSQMQIYKKLIDEGFIDEIEYVFSTKSAAEANFDEIFKLFDNGETGKVSYIDDLGMKKTL